MVQQLKVVNGQVILSYTLLDMWLLINTGVIRPRGGKSQNHIVEKNIWFMIAFHTTHYPYCAEAELSRFG